MNKAINTTAKTELIRGITQELPLLLGVFPFGMIFSVLGLEAGLTPLQVFFMSSIVFGGASQVIFVQLAGVGSGGLVIASTVGVVNLRHILYSASMTRWLSQLPLPWKIILSYLLTDEAYAVTIRRFEDAPPSPNMHYHLLGTGITLWIGWQIATLTGILIGAVIPPELGLELAIPLTFLAIIMPHIVRFPHFVTMVVSMTVAVVGYSLPWKTNIIIAAILGMIAGYATETLQARRSQ